MIMCLTKAGGAVIIYDILCVTIIIQTLHPVNIEMFSLLVCLFAGV